MAVIAQRITDKYAVYNGDCVETLQTFPESSMHLSIYSPPFSDLYSYSSSERDMSNCKTYEQFLQNYAYLVEQIQRVTMPGRQTCVHCCDLVRSGGVGLRDFPGDIIRLHESKGFLYHARYTIWKDPLRMAIKTRAIGLRHSQIVKDSCRCDNARADFLLVFRKRGVNAEPVAHPEGLLEYEGMQEPEDRLRNSLAPIPADLEPYRKGHPNPRANRWSHWIWQHYASSVWNDIRWRRCLEYRKARDKEDEKHVCPLQLDIINRCMVLWSNPGDKVLTPFMGVGSEVCGALMYGRRGIGVELKPAYYKQAVKNIHRTLTGKEV